jgi:hypothetical protein
MKLIVSDILIDHFHGHQAALTFISQQLVGGETLAISVVTLTELSGGMRPGDKVPSSRFRAIASSLPRLIAAPAPHYAYPANSRPRPPQNVAVHSPR